MSVVKLCTSGNLDAMKSDEGNDSLDTFIRQAVGKEHVLPFARTGDSPVQWFQLLHSLDQPDLPGWPLLSPVKVQMQKCEKCSREFCSPVNYRRHIRVHRRSLNVDKESHKNRDLLAAFWDKLSLKESMEIVSLSEVMLKDIPGSSIVRALASSLRKPGLTLPPVYVKAGSALLDIIHSKPSRLPISSQELFGILDNASERTFLCAGTADSVQKYVFDVEAAKNSLELKNLVACTGFLFELQLVKAWIADKDAEALRCHKQLVEEEEAAEKRQAELLERKKQKKLRQKEQKVKELLYEGNGCLTVTVDAVDEPVLAEASATPSPSDSDSNSPKADKFIQSYFDSFQNRGKEEEIDIEAQLDFNSECTILDDFQALEPGANDHQRVAISNWQVPKSHKAGRNGFLRKNPQPLKPEATQRLRPTKGQALVNGNKVWTKKFKSKSAGESLKGTFPGDFSSQVEETNSEVMIGSISIALKVCDSRQIECHPDESQGTSSTEHAILEKNNIQEEPTKAGSVQSGTKGEAASTSAVENGNKESDMVYGVPNMNERFKSSERCAPSHSTDYGDDDDHDSGKHICLLSGETPQQEQAPFSSITAKEFLALRWKRAISADHVRLVLSSGPETPRNSDKTATQASGLGEISVLGNVENQLGNSQGMSRTKPEKSLRIKYRRKEKGVV